MPDELRPLKHHTYETADDDALARECRQHLLRLPTKQLMAQLLVELRRVDPAWWSAAQLRSFWPATTRMLWFTQRSDLRQRITTELTGLSPGAARKRPPYFQAELIDAVVNEGDVSLEAFETAFDPYDMVAYGPVSSFWRRFRAQLPLDDEEPELRGLLGWLLEALLSEDGCFEGHKRKPILSAIELRTAIDGEAWHKYLPLSVRVAIDEARFRQERLRPGRPFAARHDLRIATADVIAQSLPLAALEPVLDAAERAMGLEAEAGQAMLPLGEGSVVIPRQSVKVPLRAQATTMPATPAAIDVRTPIMVDVVEPDSGEIPRNGASYPRVVAENVA
ncbi:MAG: hypothetical protein R3B72_50270 [Polyangiaceae bacterium]